MATPTLEELQQEGVVMSVARALALTNKTAIAYCVDPAKSLVMITEDASANGPVWRISYGPHDYVNRRGGDLIVFVDAESYTIQRIMRGQ